MSLSKHQRADSVPSKQRKNRKRRKIKNSLVNIDDITIGPGHEFAAWTEVARGKLKEREIGLIVKRIDACRQIIDSSLSEFNRENTAYFFESRQKTTVRVINMDKANRQMYSECFARGQFEQLMQECTQHIEYTLSNWDGVKSSKRIRKKMISFRSYFIPSKNWFDQTKIGIMASYFWIPLFNLIDRMTQSAAAIFFSDRFRDLQGHYSQYLKALILWNMVSAMMSVPNTRDVLVIPAACYSKLKDDLHVQLYQCFAEPEGTELGRDKMNSTEVRLKAVESVAAYLPRSRTRFQESLFALHDEVDNYGVNPVDPLNLNTINGIDDHHTMGINDGVPPDMESSMGLEPELTVNAMWQRPGSVSVHQTINDDVTVTEVDVDQIPFTVSPPMDGMDFINSQMERPSILSPETIPSSHGEFSLGMDPVVMPLDIGAEEMGSPTMSTIAPSPFTMSSMATHSPLSPMSPLSPSIAFNDNAFSNNAFSDNAFGDPISMGSVHGSGFPQCCDMRYSPF